VPLALVFLMLTANGSGNRAADKLFWLTLACAVARGAEVARTAAWRSGTPIPTRGSHA
jgi:hypothetical protein